MCRWRSTGICWSKKDHLNLLMVYVICSLFLFSLFKSIQLHIFIFLLACMGEMLLSHQNLSPLDLFSCSPSSRLSILLSDCSDPHLVCGRLLPPSRPYWWIFQWSGSERTRGPESDRWPSPFYSLTALLSLPSRGSTLLVMGWNMIWV